MLITDQNEVREAWTGMPPGFVGGMGRTASGADLGPYADTSATDQQWRITAAGWPAGPGTDRPMTQAGTPRPRPASSLAGRPEPGGPCLPAARAHALDPYPAVQPCRPSRRVAQGRASRGDQPTATANMCIAVWLFAVPWLTFGSVR